MKKKTDLQIKLEKELEVLKEIARRDRGKSFKLDMAYLKEINKIKDMLANEILEQELFDGQ